VKVAFVALPGGAEEAKLIMNRVAHRREPQPQGGGAGGFGGEDDAAIVARRRVFLVLESERESLAAGIRRQLRPSRRFEDLCLVKMVTRLESDYLREPTHVGSGADQSWGAVARALDHGVADWARPWGPTCLMQLESDLTDFDDKLRNARRWLSAGTQTAANARAGERFVEMMAKMAGWLKAADFTLPGWASRSSLTSLHSAPRPKASKPARRPPPRRPAHRPVAFRRAAPRTVATRRDGPREAASQGRIDINEATYEQFRALQLTITQSRRLLAYRKRVKRFESIDELDAIPGFPRTVLERLKHRLTV
jgi:DNA uptake protein ComE-like DNA-binding protein